MYTVTSRWVSGKTWLVLPLKLLQFALRHAGLLLAVGGVVEMLDMDGAGEARHAFGFDAVAELGEVRHVGDEHLEAIVAERDHLANQ
jgi:hypothetical protein